VAITKLGWRVAVFLVLEAMDVLGPMFDHG